MNRLECAVWHCLYLIAVKDGNMKGVVYFQTKLREALHDTTGS